MELSFTQNGYFSLKNRQHLFLVVQNASRCFGTKGENHSKNSGGNQKMTPTPTRILQDPPWCSRKCIELARITYFTAYRRTLNPVKRPNLACFCIKPVDWSHYHLWSSIFLFKYFYCRKVWWTSFDSPLQTAGQSTEQRSLLDGGSNLQRRCSESEELIETAFSWLLDRWFSWMWRAVISRCSIWGRGARRVWLQGGHILR